jgi:succinate dehydrogenase/fumarate reductase flavoprotein subunit
VSAHASPYTGEPPAEVDLVVVGSGAAGLTAAVTAAAHGLAVVVVEKDTVCGGATAWSGGWIWVPCNPLSRAEGVVEDVAAARTYLQHELGREFEAARVDALLEHGPAMVAFLESRTTLQFVSGTAIADIHGDTPGAGTGGRSVAPKPYDARGMDPALFAITRAQKPETALLGMGIMAGPDLHRFLHATRSLRAFAHVARRLGRHVLDLAVRGRSLQLVNGTALVARLLVSADALGVAIRVSTPAIGLARDGAAVRGVEVVSGGRRTTIRARRGVVLAAGGFPHDRARRSALIERLPGGGEAWALPPEAVDGDGIRLGESAGGRLATDVASTVAWCPVSVVPYRDGAAGLHPHIVDRGKPGVIGVLADGRRFCNEADGYHDYVSAMLAAIPPGREVASWLVCDHAFLRRYPFGMAKPFPVPLRPWLANGYLQRGTTIAALARACGIDAAGLVATLDGYNHHARRGEDPAFGRGRTRFNRGSGDPDHGPNPCVAPIEKAPFYAIKVLPGSFGTFAGLATDAQARVLDAVGAPIDGLYAVGCDQASVMGGHYPSGGINLGPAMTFGYVAGRHAAGGRAPVGAPSQRDPSGL